MNRYLHRRLLSDYDVYIKDSFLLPLQPDSVSAEFKSTFFEQRNTTHPTEHGCLLKQARY